MAKQFLYSVTTKLDQSQVWELLTDIENWTRTSLVYQQLAWEGEPWVCGSSIVGTILYPTKLHFRYVLREFQPPTLIRYRAHGKQAGFASERVIELESISRGTLIKVSAFVVGEPVFSISGGSLGFLKMLTERWFQDFATLCDGRVAAKPVATDHSP
jgi:hypothetical protein